MDPIVDTLLTSFRQVPPATVPAMLDCILTSTGSSPSSLFSSLINEFANISKEFEQGDGKLEVRQRDSMVSYLRALCHLLDKSGANVLSMHLFTWNIWIPLLRLVNSYDYELFNEASRLFCDIVIKGDKWEVVEATVVPFLLRLVGQSLGMQESGERSIYKWTSYTTFGDFDKHLIGWQPSHVGKSTDVLDISNLSQCYYFPLNVSCNILAIILDSALQINCLKGSDSGNECSSKRFAGNLLWDLSNITFQMLSESSEHRASAIRFFLPSIFKALHSTCAFEALVCGQTCVLSRRHLSVKIQKSCRMLFTLGPVERRDAYAVLSLYFSFFSSSGGCEEEHGAGDEIPHDLRTEDFWDEIRRGLVDKENFARKQSLHILKAAVNLNMKDQSDSNALTAPGGISSVPHGMTKKGLWADKEAKSLGVGRICNFSDVHSKSQQKWEAFFLLYEMLEEYGTHLVDAAWNNQISLLLDSSLQSDRLANSDNLELCIQMETPEQIFGWLAVLWERGFSHDNPQVRCLVMQSFLGIEWKNYGDYAKLVTESFIHGPFIQGLNDPVHHKDFGVKGVYSSWTIEAASKFSYQYASCLAKRKQRSLIIGLALVAKKQSFGRAGLMCLAECVASAARGFKRPSTDELQQLNDSVDLIQLRDARENPSQNFEVELLEVLKYIIESSKQHFNSNYRQQVCKKILAAAASVMTALDVPLEILLYFISSLPREYTDHGGLLRLKLQEWLLASNERPCTSSFSDLNLQLLKLLNKFPRSFVGLHHSKDTTITYDDEDLDAWEFEANRWARTIFLVIQEELDVEPILKFIQEYGLHICKNTHMTWVPVKFLILASCLVHELEIIQDRTIHSRMKGISIKDVDIPDTAGHTCSTKYSNIFENFAKSLSSILEELVSFARLSSSILWSATVTENGNGTLPGTIKGRLGGPSQRRLSSFTTTLILQAITSVKAVASISSWSMRFRVNLLLDSAFTFLWNFCWKVITSPTCQSETEAEISLAAYESLAYVLKSLVTTFSPLSLELLMGIDDSTPVEEEHRPVLDTFLRTFLQNINNLIAVGSFARTRRAVLMNWKWICLESLLAIPKCAIRNGVHNSSCNFFFSDVTLRHIFGDLVDSLENAGEVSVLPMLRSVRLILELFASGQMGSLVSSGDGVNSQMIWHLVHSSWILHASCNKRRVAPIAALLSSVLHNSVFSNESMHESNNAPGPMKWFVEKILEEGTRSPRTIRLAALHLVGLWLENPNIMKYYIKEMKLLTLYGSVAFDEDFEAELAENQDAKIEVSVLAKSPDPELTEEFINTELYARVSLAVLFYKLGEMDDTLGSTSENKSSTDVIASGKMFMLELLNSVIDDKDLSKELYKKHSAIHRRKIRVWQMICVLSRFTDQDILENVTCTLHISLQRNNLPSVRQYLETCAIQIYLRFPSLVEQDLVPLLRKYDMRPQALSSYVFIAANVILHSTKAFQPRHLAELLPPIVPLLTSHHHTLRGFTQLLVYKVLQKLLPVKEGPTASVTMSLENKCFEDLKHYLADNPDCARLRASMEGYLDAFDPKASISPSGIFSNRVEELEFECVSTSLMDRVIYFLNVTREDLRSSMVKDAIAINNESLRANDDLMPKRELAYSSEEPKSLQMTQDNSLDFQKKITFSRDDMQGTMRTIVNRGESFESLIDIETEDQLFYELLNSRCGAVEKLKASRQDFILVASFLDRIPNLAGLARTCEVFRAAGLAISDKSILNDKQFQLISVTAEKWVPIIEVPIGSVKMFLESKKQEGFAVLGLEQTANSISLDHFDFPKKTVLVLGREKEGIPVEIIHILDACVEIPQLGVVRSLNVHVSGAIALWEYTRQHQRSRH